MDMLRIGQWLAGVTLLVKLSACASSDVEPTFRVESVSEVALAAITGAIATARNAALRLDREGACPTPLTTGNGCSASGATLTLTFSECLFSKSDGTGFQPRVWNGSLLLTLAAGTAACGTFPKVASSSTAKTYGPNTSVLLNDMAGALHTTVLNTANPSGFAGSVSGGWSLGWNALSELATITVLGVRAVATKVAPTKKGQTRQLSAWDFTLTTAAVAGAPVAPTVLVVSPQSSTLTVSGTIIVQDNAQRVIYSTTLSNVAYGTSGDCLQPQSGQVTTQGGQQGESVEIGASGSCGRAILTRGTTAETVTLVQLF